MSQSPFEGAARAAINDLIEKHAQVSKFGLILSPQGQRELCEDIVEFLQVSRRLKAAGDRLLSGLGGAPTTGRGPGIRG